MERLIQLDNLNMQEALRYLGSGGQTPDDAFMALMKDCEKTVFAQARPRYVYRIFDISECDEGVRAEGTDFILRGNSIKKHLKGCKKAAFFAATISDGITDCTGVRHYESICNGQPCKCGSRAGM